MQDERLTAQARAVFEGLVAAWNADDLDTMFELFVPEAHWVNIVGMHWQGRDQVELAHRAYFALMFNGVSQTLEEVESVVALPGGGAVVVGRIHMEAFRQPDGVIRPAGLDRMTLVLVPEGDRLKIAHGANIAILEEAQRFDPVRRAHEPA